MDEGAHRRRVHDTSESSDSPGVQDFPVENIVQDVQPIAGEVMNNPYIRAPRRENISIKDNRTCKDCDRPVCTKLEDVDELVKISAQKSQQLKSMKYLMFANFTVTTSIFIFLLLTNFPDKLARPSCPDGWVSDSLGRCYRFVSTKTSWHRADGLCMDMGGKLATLQDNEQIQWMHSYRHSHKNHKREHYWIGGFRKDGAWTWGGEIKDSLITKTDWAPYEPNNYGGNEDCMAIAGDPSYQWNDQACTLHLAFVCERKESNGK